MRHTILHNLTASIVYLSVAVAGAIPITAAAAIVPSAPARATSAPPATTAASPDDDSSYLGFSFSAFGTLGTVHSNETRADFTSSALKPNGAGYSHPWSTDIDSRLGGQVIEQFASQWSTDVQVIAEQQDDNTYRPHFEWANLKYSVTPEFSLRVGRIVLPSFLFADTRKVGYADPWLRPPVELYNILPFTNSDGVDASLVLHGGGLTHNLSATYGRINASAGHARDLALVADTIEYGAASLRIAYQRAHLTVPSIEIPIAAFRNFGSAGYSLADRYGISGKRAHFLGFSTQYDPGDWFVLAEWGHSQTHSALGDSTAWYASGGYRWRKLTPYVIYSTVSVTSNTRDPGLTLSNLPADAAAAAAGLNATLNAILGAAAAQTTASIGLRWDVLRNLDLKLQYDHLQEGAGSQGTLINVQPGFQRGGQVHVVSVAIDFVL